MPEVQVSQRETEAINVRGGGGCLFSNQMLTIKVVTLTITMYRHKKSTLCSKLSDWLVEIK